MGFFCVFTLLTVSALALAQDTVEAPLWAVGEKWTFTGGDSMEVIEKDENSYTVKYLSSAGKKFINIRDKSSLNLLYYVLEGGKRKEYKGGFKRGLNFPLTIGKKWKDRFSSKSFRSGLGDSENMYFETFKVLSWEEIEVKAGKFKALKIEYKQEGMGQGRNWVGKCWFWYSPEVKYFIKFQTEKSFVWIGINDWDLVSYELKNKSQWSRPK